ncbi:MAG: S8 family serine peptidase [Pikeienuella sp.]
MSASRVKKLTGRSLAHRQDYGAESTGADGMADASALMLDRLKTLVIRTDDPDEASHMQAAFTEERDVAFVRPEYYVYPTDTFEARYAEWVREGLDILVKQAVRTPLGPRFASPELAVPAATQMATWGVRAVQADLSSYTGAGIKVAVLDTGFDFTHPDFQDREIVRASFVPTKTAQDMQGHGTHCAGTVVGGSRPDGLRYGVAPNAELHVGKVLGPGGGAESWLLAGMDWAVDQGCDVISMSLGRTIDAGEGPDPLFEQAGETALANGCLVVAAAGNDSRRPRFVAPVNAPANARSILAVSAIDEAGEVAFFSNQGQVPGGGEVDLCAPGVDILSSTLEPRRYEELMGTSMATPHVAGVAALLAESDPELRGRALWAALANTASNVNQRRVDVGSGLAQAPVRAGPGLTR